MAQGTPDLWKTRIPVPDPPVAEILNLWRMQFDTSQIARMLGCREAAVYNILARISK